MCLGLVWGRVGGVFSSGRCPESGLRGTVPWWLQGTQKGHEGVKIGKTGEQIEPWVKKSKL